MLEGIQEHPHCISHMVTNMEDIVKAHNDVVDAHTGQEKNIMVNI